MAENKTTSITFITSLIYIPHYENIDTWISNFTFLAETGIKIAIYCALEYNTYILHLAEKYPNIKLIGIRQLKDSWIYNLVMNSGLNVELPEKRNVEKDTTEYIISMHLKHELLADAIMENPWNSSHYAWIDFNIAHLFRNKSETSTYLKWLSSAPLQSPYLALPGCWSKWERQRIHDITNAVHWRFCGGFLIGDCVSITRLCTIYKTKMRIFLTDYGKLVWDFNIWAWLETICDENEDDDHDEDTSDNLLSITWYKADHNDSILVCSADIYTQPLPIVRKVVYDYPSIPNYYATSASYLFYQGRHILNTRYVNYWIYPNGCYLFHNSNRLIENINMFSELNSELVPTHYTQMQENINIPVYPDSFSNGLEDIRLFEYKNQIKYIATTVGYSNNGRNRMIVGNYNIDTANITNSTVIKPPNADSWCEKNWIPIIKNHEDLLYVYKWYPLEIGRVNEETSELNIIKSLPMPLIIFQKIRGSTVFMETYDGLLAVVHYSEEHAPRHYYHMLVLLDRDNFELINYTNTFCFEKLGIEFCIGFTRQESQYVFWISSHDREPSTIYVNMSDFSWVNVV